MQIIGYTESSQGAPFETVTAAGRAMQYPKATEAEINKAVELARKAFASYRFATGAQKAAFLRAIAEEIESLGDELVKTVMAESGLPEGRVKGERGRTCSQLHLFADLVQEGSWVEAVIDHGDRDLPALALGLFLSGVQDLVGVVETDYGFLLHGSRPCCLTNE